MNLRVELDAVADVAAAHDWYERQRPGLGAEFQAAFVSALRRIVETPGLGVIVHRGVRRVLMGRFPYAIYFRVTADTILILACIHARRHPRHWRDRT